MERVERDPEGLYVTPQEQAGLVHKIVSLLQGEVVLLEITPSDEDFLDEAKISW